ncbi:MAG: FAD-dependent oxidoreductase [Bacteroidia bacterium]|nr:FAD-dependent oxidoreductase [Bacteroidia bacterium]
MVDVAIIGGGVSGLYAAHLLKQAGVSVEVIEGQQRLGGRLHTIYTPEGHPVDLGGQWIGPQHTRALRWNQRHHIPLHRTHTAGAHLLLTPQQRKKYKGTIPRLSWLALLDLGIGLMRLRKMASRVDPAYPWHISTAEWDEVSLAAWIRRTFYTRKARETFEVGLSTVLGCEPEEVSLWHTLFYLRSAGSLEALIETEGGAQELKFSQGAITFVHSLAQDIPYRLGERVHRVEIEPTRVKLICEGGYQLSARAVFVAIPPAQTGTIQWTPPLPPLYQQLSQHMPMGSVTKIVAIYDTPFWREKGLSGHILRLHGALRLTFDTSPSAGEYGQITGFGVGKLARSLLHVSSNERTAYYEKEMEALFGAKPKWLFQKTWAEEPSIGGCYTGYFGPGGWRYFGQVLRTHLPPLYWVGTERSSTWMGYIEGAMAAAEEAVQSFLTTAHT